ncbi:MAG: glycerophosphodiester phosphodiesterase [Nannocystaceae bacterium]
MLARSPLQLPRRSLGACLLTLGACLLACAPTPDAASASDATSTSPMTSTAATDASTGTAGATSTTDTTTGADEDDLLLGDRLLNIAHRGGRVERPEATLLAFAHALEVGADVLEFDVHASSDGVLVAIHDDTVDRTTDGAGEVRSMTFAALQALDAGYTFSPDDGATHPYRGMGLTIPSVAEIFAAFPDAHFIIEIKQTEPPIAGALVDLLAEHDLLDRTVLAAFDSQALLEVRAQNPGVITSLNVDEMLDLHAHIGDPDYAAPARFVHSPWELTSPELVDFAHGLGLKVHPWTVNSPFVMDDMIEVGVDGIMTDDPALLESRLDPG